MERSANTQVDQLRGSGAPRAPMPGMGVGNVPFSPGMASGQLGPQAAPPPPPPGPPPMSFGPSGGPPPGGPPPGGPPPGGPPPMIPGMGAGVDPMLMTQTYFSYMSELMHAITGAYKRAAAQPGLPWGY